MENVRNENIVDKIKKLLTLSKDEAATEAEAQAAALAAQKLLAKYNMDMDEVMLEKEPEVIKDIMDSSEFKGYLWAKQLANTVAKNYSCKLFLRGNNIVFYGYKEHTEIAKEVFRFLFEIGNKLALQESREYYREHGNCKGVYNSFAMGFYRGVKSKLDEQCVALSIVVPSKVEEAYKNLDLCVAKTKHITISSQDAEISQKGYQAGREAFDRRSLNEAV